jgi:glycerophosphoryl diester phosphodiesterase
MVHRGGPRGTAEGEPADSDSDFVENTAAAFRRAYRLGFRCFETDVHATRDGVLVANHDASLTRVGGYRVRVADLTVADLEDLPVGGEPLPRLRDLLAEFPDVRFNIDPKADAAVRPLVDLLTVGDLLDRVCVASFSDRRLRWVRAALGARVCTAAGPRELAAATGQAGRGQPLEVPGADVLQIPRVLARQLPGVRGRGIDLLGAARRVGMPVHVWTVNDAAEMDLLLERGVDGVMSDDTGLLESVFRAHGWAPAT